MEPLGEPEALSASKMIGSRVVNHDGEDVGKIQDVMIDPDSGRVTYAILSFGGFLGMGDKLFAIPWPSLRRDVDGRQFLLHVHKDRLRNAPGFARNDWPPMGDTYWGTDVPKFWT